MRGLIFLFLFGLVSCGDPCSCDFLSNDPFNSSPLPNGCGCLVEKVYVPGIGTDADGVDTGAEVTGTTDLQKGHKVK